MSYHNFYGGISTPTVSVDARSQWGRSSFGGQFSSASLVSQAKNSSFNFNMNNGVINMASVAVTGPNVKSGNSTYSWDAKRATAFSFQEAPLSVMSYWKLSGRSTTGRAFLSPEPFTQYPADSPAGYSSI
jgi:hypothetical protein